MDNNYLIELYLKGQLSQEEEQNFRERLKTDKALRDTVLAEALMIKQMKHQNQENEKVILKETESYKEIVESAAADREVPDSFLMTGREEVVSNTAGSTGLYFGTDV